MDIDSERMILEIYDMTPLDENPILSKSNDIRYVLEVKQAAKIIYISFVDLLNLIL